MKEKSFFIFAFLLVVFIGNFVTSESQIVSVNYEDWFNQTFSYEIFSSSFILEVHTLNSTDCRYSNNEDFNFSKGSYFEPGLGKVHEKTFLDFPSGVSHYYVKCYEGSSQVNLSLLITPLLTGKVFLYNNEEVLFLNSQSIKSGRVKVVLGTSKAISSVPVLKYSFDGIVYNPLTLVESQKTIGSQKAWEGYLIIDDGIGEGLVSFELKAAGLEDNARKEIEITSGAVYAIDTIKPKTVSAISAQGYNGGIELKWHLDEEFDYFRVYRSESPGVSYTDLYREEVDDDNFRDTSVLTGQTYYYKVSAVDEAGNEGDLSIEFYAAPTLSNSTSAFIGLSLNLQGEVDGFLNEIDFARSEVKDIKSSISYKAEEEKELFSLMKLDSEIENAISSLNSLYNDVEKYKKQDLTKTSLEQKISSARIKIEAIKKKIPEDITILDEKNNIKKNFNEDKLREAIIESSPFFDENQIGESVKKSLDSIKEKNLEIESDFYSVEILYSDGSKKIFSVVEHDLNSGFTKGDDGKFIEVIPKEVVESASKIVVGNLNYDVLKEDPVLSFGPDTKRIFYFFEENPGIDLLKEVSTNFVSLVNNEEEGSNLITGYFSFDVGNRKYTWLILGAIFFLCAGGYFFYRRKNRFSDNYFGLLRKIKEVDDMIGKDSIESIEREYGFIRANYSSLINDEKMNIYPRIEKLRDKVFVLKIEEGLTELNKTENKKLFLRMEKMYNAMTEKSRKKLEKVFLQVKRDVELKEMEAKGRKEVATQEGGSSEKKDESKKESSPEKVETKNEEENEKSLNENEDK